MDVTHDSARRLTDEQDAALETLSALADTQIFRVALLHGVTGSGKTGSTCGLPIASADRTAGAAHGAGDRLDTFGNGLFRSAFGARWPSSTARCPTVNVATSGNAFAAATSTWWWAPGRLCLRRSRILASSSSTKRATAQSRRRRRYHGRDVATRAGRLALVVLGSATPSMESYQNGLR